MTANRGAGRTFPAGGNPKQVTTTDDAGNTIWTANGARTVTAVKTSAYTAEFGDVVRGDTTSAGFNVTLPTPTSATDAPVTVKRTAGSNDITVVGTIDGGTNTTVSTTAKTFVTDGTNWITI